MTYCLAIRLDAGLVLASDSRTSAGVDDLNIYSKMHRFDTAGDRVIALLSSGNLATTQAVIKRIERDLGDASADTNLDQLAHLDEVARYVGEISAQIQNDFSGQAEQNAGLMQAFFILAGQIRGEAHDAFLIYPQGNYIAVSRNKPFLQIGETKYGKPILDRIIDAGISLERAGRCAIISMDASMRSNLSVGPPIELLIYRADSFEVERRCRFDQDDAYLQSLSRAWADGLDRLFLELPRFPWEA
ncbi:peptidase [Wenzhouxiangella marina]|uniref:20S proteasome, A and B subunits n=1 Tax=Wenzhouxiangella marina TaxID=1579979 RepID=A0A0K0XZ11_9GAMM|nr:peptidase [Wenzhouxiangella marina]AKS42910.1 20S proteasome, A and B subunits [Wenzhouxiangella marina]MBB6087407.1 putative proteasome-type protease [Wenzhouxiangella marina]